jgi:hypothetical protein
MTMTDKETPESKLRRIRKVIMSPRLGACEALAEVVNILGDEETQNKEKPDDEAEREDV